jgi:hypothetical protein
VRTIDSILARARLAEDGCATVTSNAAGVDKPLKLKKKNTVVPRAAGPITEAVKSWTNTNDNDHLGKTSKQIGDAVHKTQKPFGQKEKAAIDDYASHSETLNKKLHGGEALTQNEEKTKSGLDAASNRKVKHDIHVYSGIRHDPSESGRLEDDGHIHLKMKHFRSVSHNKKIALTYAYNNQKDDTKHILHIHVKRGDKMGYIARENARDGVEGQEHVLPRNTVLKIHPKPQTVKANAIGESNETTHIWHATVHHQE